MDWKRFRTAAIAFGILAILGGFSNAMASSSLPAVEWGPLLELNDEAARIWEQLISCAPGQSEAGRTEYAVKAYFKGDFCSDDKKQRALLLAQLRNLHENFHQFLLTSLLPSWTEIPADQRTLPLRAHPLLAQVHLEFLAELTHEMLQKDRQTRWEIDRQLRALQGTLGSRDRAIAEGQVDASLFDHGKMLFSKLVMNAHLFPGYAGVESFEQLGLRPKDTQGFYFELSHAYTDLSLSSFLHQTAGKTLDLISYLCGPFPMEEWANTRHRAKFNQELRGLAHRYRIQ